MKISGISKISDIGGPCWGQKQAEINMICCTCWIAEDEDLDTGYGMSSLFSTLLPAGILLILEGVIWGDDCHPVAAMETCIAVSSTLTR